MNNTAAGPYRVHLLGTFEIVGARDLTSTDGWRSQQSRTLLKFLLLNRGHVITADQLLELLWPNEDPEASRPRLYVRISQLRRMLDPEKPQAHIKTVEGRGYRFEVQPTWWVDVDAFDAAAEGGREAQEAGALSDAIAFYEEAHRLYRGDLLEEDRYADWAFVERERLLERYLTLLTELAEAYAQKGRYRRAIALYQRVLDRDPFREAVFVRLMLAYSHAGEQVHALRTFERCRRLLAEEMGVAPLPATQALAEEIRTGTYWTTDTAARYPPPAYDGRLFEIPYSLADTPFVGREREHAWLIARWREQRPGLVLVEGEAGAGKTRLVDEALGFAATHGATVLRIPPLTEGLTAPYAPVIEALRPIWRPETLSNLPVAHRRLLASLFTPTPSPVRRGESEGHDIARALAHWLRSELTPGTLLFVDDAPRLDPASLTLVLELTHLLTLVVTARTDELPPAHPLRSAFHELARAQRAGQLRLNRLPDEAVTTLIWRLAKRELPTLTTQLVAHTAGNPLFLVAALQTLFEEGTLYVDEDGSWSHVEGQIAIPPASRHSSSSVCNA